MTFCSYLELLFIFIFFFLFYFSYNFTKDIAVVVDNEQT